MRFDFHDVRKKKGAGARGKVKELQNAKHKGGNSGGLVISSIIGWRDVERRPHREKEGMLGRHSRIAQMQRRRRCEGDPHRPFGSIGKSTRARSAQKDRKAKRSKGTRLAVSTATWTRNWNGRGERLCPRLGTRRIAPRRKMQ